MQRGLEVATPTDTTIVMKRTFDAPRELVFEAMTDPALIPKWIFSPPGWTMTTCEGELRVGGKYRWEWSDENGVPALTIHGQNLEVDAPRRIVHTETMEMGSCGPIGTLVSAVDLEEEGGRTHMTMTLTFDSKEARDGAIQSGMAQGMEAGYQQMDALLAESA
ncbi:MAG: SRPBCC family protein [Planctomycetota bacterium]